MILAFTIDLPKYFCQTVDGIVNLLSVYEQEIEDIPVSMMQKIKMAIHWEE